jgi:DNA-binding NtrC family response regulator
METRKIQVLVVGECARTPSHLAKRVEERGCTCEFADTYHAARMLLECRNFDLMLSPVKLGKSSMLPLMKMLRGSRSTAFYYQVVEDSCWWLPAIFRGQVCFGQNALRPSEFIPILDKAIDELRTGAAALVPEGALAAPA